ncbi:MAG TPA: c-type cytochrome, partial [Acidobacteriota bacterium]|nr:c-type cytochrome [Acidobacteriota bacterium]
MKKTVGNLRSSHGFSIHFYGLLAVLTIISGVNGFCAELAAQEQPQEKSAEQQFKNIKVFQGLPVSQLLPAMTYMEAALGVQCSYCHVGRDFDKDDKEQKDSARKMITMVRDINQTNFGGRNEVTCNTCHHGQAHPASLPTVVEITGKAPSPQPRMEQKSTEPLPSAAQILEKYVQALGGKNALDKIETRVMRGTRVTSDGSSAPFEVYQKAPNKMLAIYKFG